MLGEQLDGLLNGDHRRARRGAGILAPGVLIGGALGERFTHVVLSTALLWGNGDRLLVRGAGLGNPGLGIPAALPCLPGLLEQDRACTVVEVRELGVDGNPFRARSRAAARSGRASPPRARCLVALSLWTSPP